MGVPWCAECVSLLYEYITKDYEHNMIFKVTEFWNMLQGKLVSTVDFEIIHE